jgi:hypothetical protein
MQQPTQLTLIVLTMVFSLALHLAATSADPVPPFEGSKPVEPRIKEIRVEKVGALTGIDSPTEMKLVKQSPLWRAPHQPAFTAEDGEQKKIPTAMVSVGDRIYLHSMSVHGFSKVGKKIF